jgi:excinuclease ABC subunit A
MSERFACIDCGISLPPIEPRMFSFNGPHGACPACDGLGARTSSTPSGASATNGARCARASCSRGGVGARGARDGAGARRRGARGEPRRAVGRSSRTSRRRSSSARAAQAGKKPAPRRGAPRSKPTRGSCRASSSASIAGRRAVDEPTTTTTPTRAKGASPTTSSGAFSSRARATPARARLRPEALAVKLGGKDIAQLGAMPLRHVRDFVGSSAESSDGSPTLRAPRAGHRRAAAQGGGRAPRLPHRRGARLPHARSQRADALVRRGAAHPPRHADRRRARRRPLRARRAERRPPRARQRAPHRGAGRLRDLGNTVIVVEHDREAILAPTTSSTWGPARACTAGTSSRRGRRTS